MRSVKAFLLLLTSTLCLAQSPVDRLTAPIESGLAVPLKGNLHGGARPEFDQGRVDGRMAMPAVSLVFKPSPAQQSALDQLLAQQQDRMSPNYHTWLTPAQFGDRFGMSKSDIGKVSSWLQSQGFTVTRVAPSRNEVFFSGTAAQVESAFHTELHHYLVNGEMHFANATEPSVPAALSGVALAIRNLHNFEPKPRAHLRRVPASEASPHFTSSLSGNHFLAPEDFATIYHVQGLYGAGIDGAGQKIAVIGQSAISLADVRNFRSAAVLPAKDPTLLLVPSSGNSTTCPGDEGESDLDVEWSGGVAKNASIILVYEGVPSGQTCSNRTNGAFDALDYTVNAVPQIAPIISISYGLCENTNSAVGITQAQALSLRTLAQQANTQGQTITSATGDNGAADCEAPQTSSAVQGLAVDIPAAIPEVTGVGGSEFTGDSATCPSTGCPSNTAPADPPYWSGSGVGTDTISSALEYIPEMAWNDTLDTTDNPQGFLSASGGGVSIYFAKPAWQAGTGMRDVPDIALNASPFHDPYLFCSEDGPSGTKVSSCTSGFRDSSQALSVVGGTSAGAPTFAAILALVDQSLIASGFESAPGLGNVNPILYQLAGSNPTAFNDVPAGTGSNNIVPCAKASPNCPASPPLQFGFTAGPGYDQVTGLGSVNANILAAAWAGTPNFTLQPNAATFSVVAGNSAQVTVTVHSLNGFNSALTFTCSDPASESTCVPPSGATTQSSVTFNLTTTAPTARLGSPFSRRGSVFYALLVPGLLGVLMAAGQRKPTARGMRLLGLIVALGFSTLWFAACGGSSSNKNPGTTKGTYTVKLTATSGGTNPISNSTQVTLIVQ